MCQNSDCSNIKRISGLLLGLVLVAGCYDPPPPEKVFIPGPHAKTEITIAVSDNRVNVNEPVILYASRRTSGFVEIPYSELPEGVQWWRQIPPIDEVEVAGNLKWIVEPEGKARFNTDLRKDHTREVRFTEPGRYEIYGVSAFPGPENVGSKTVVIEVHE